MNINDLVLNSGVELEEIILSLVLSLLIGTVIALVNEKLNKGFSYERSFSRMTIDSNTCCSRYKGDLDFPTIPLFISGDSIFEIKTSDAIPLWLQRIIIKYGLKRFAISKYGFSIEKLSQSNEIAIHDNFLLNF